MGLWPKRKKNKDLGKIAADDLVSMRKGAISPESAFRHYTVIRTVHKLDDGNAKKSLNNFYQVLKSEYPELYSLLIGE